MPYFIFPFCNYPVRVGFNFHIVPSVSMTIYDTSDIISIDFGGHCYLLVVDLVVIVELLHALLSISKKGSNYKIYCFRSVNFPLKVKVLKRHILLKSEVLTFDECLSHTTLESLGKWKLMRTNSSYSTFSLCVAVSFQFC